MYNSPGAGSFVWSAARADRSSRLCSPQAGQSRRVEACDAVPPERHQNKRLAPFARRQSERGTHLIPRASRAPRDERDIARDRLRAPRSRRPSAGEGRRWRRDRAPDVAREFRRGVVAIALVDPVPREVADHDRRNAGRAAAAATRAEGCRRRPARAPLSRRYVASVAASCGRRSETRRPAGCSPKRPAFRLSI